MRFTATFAVAVVASFAPGCSSKKDEPKPTTDEQVKTRPVEGSGAKLPARKDAATENKATVRPPLEVKPVACAALVSKKKLCTCLIAATRDPDSDPKHVPRDKPRCKAVGVAKHGLQVFEVGHPTYLSQTYPLWFDRYFVVHTTNGKWQVASGRRDR